MAIKSKSLNCVHNLYTEVLEIADRDFAIRHSKLKMTDPIWRLKIRRAYVFLKIGIPGFRGS